jgi:hypothetical protein
MSLILVSSSLSPGTTQLDEYLLLIILLHLQFQINNVIVDFTVFLKFWGLTSPYAMFTYIISKFQNNAIDLAYASDSKLR